MAKPISVDLRQRVCSAVAEGVSCRQAAARFKVSVSSAIRWQAQFRRSGSVAPNGQGGDRRSGRIETHAAFILGEYEAKSDITLSELQTGLAARGVHVGIGTLWRFFDRRRITLKKRQRTQPSRNVPM
jgi:transposase